MYLFICDRITGLSQRLSRNFYSKHLPTAGPSVSSDQDAQGCVHSGVAIFQGVPLSSAEESFSLCPAWTSYFTLGPLASPCAAQPLAAFSQPPAHRCRLLPQAKPALFFHLPAWEEHFFPNASEASPELAPVCPCLSHRGPSWRQHLPMVWGVLSWNVIHVIWCLCSYYVTKYQAWESSHCLSSVLTSAQMSLSNVWMKAADSI